APLFVVILAAREWRVSRRNAHVPGVPARGSAQERPQQATGVRNSSPRKRGMSGRRRGAGRSRAAERRRRAAGRRIHLEARNASIARVGLLGLLAQDHGLVAAADRARRGLGQNAAPSARPSRGAAETTAATRLTAAIRVRMAVPLRPR